MQNPPSVWRTAGSGLALASASGSPRATLSCACALVLVSDKAMRILIHDRGLMHRTDLFTFQTRFPMMRCLEGVSAVWGADRRWTGESEVRGALLFAARTAVPKHQAPTLHLLHSRALWPRKGVAGGWVCLCGARNCIRLHAGRVRTTSEDRFVPVTPAESHFGC